MNDLDRLIAIEEIRRLEARYAYTADHRQWQALAALFTEDGWFAPQDVDGNEVARMTGRADIAAQLTARMSGAVQPIHQLFTHEIDIDSPDRARAVWAMADIIVREDSAIPAASPGSTLPPFRVMRGWGHYHVSYRRVDGQWLIATRSLSRTRLEYTT